MGCNSGAGGAGASVGKVGTGIQRKINGAIHNYFVSNTGLLVEIGGKPVKVGKLSGSQIAKRLVETGNAEFLSKKQVDDIRKERNSRKSVDYELGGGVPWGNADNRRAARRNRITTRQQRKKMVRK